MELEILQILEIVQGIQEVTDIINGNTENALIPTETLYVINSFADGEANTDVETTLEDIKDIFMYNEEYTVFEEMSSRLELIDARLDTEFTVLNEFYGFCGCTLLTVISLKFFSWLTNTFSP